MKQLSGRPDGLNEGRYNGVERRAASSRPAAPAAQPEQAFFNIDLRRSLEQHAHLARMIALGGVLLAIVYVFAQVFWFRTWPAYEADSTVYVKTTPTKVLDNGQGARWPFDANSYESYIQQQMMNVSREDVLISAVHKLDGFQGPSESDQSAAQRLGRAVDTFRIGGAYQFTIIARAGKAAEAAAIANAVTAAYIESASRDEHTGDAQRVAMLKEEKDRISAELVSDRTEQDALNAQIGVASVGAAVPDHYDEDITQTRAELVRARTEHDAAAAKFSSLGAGSGASSSQIDAMADEMVSNDAGLVSMKTSLNSRRAAIISQMANLTPANPQYKQDEQELTKINADLDAMMKDLRAKAAARIQLQLRADLQRTGGVEAQLNGQLRQLVGSASSATPKMQRSSDLAADITRLQARYAAVDEQIHDLNLEDSAPAEAYQVTPATAPLTRAKTGVVRNGFLIMCAGFALALIAAVLAQKLDARVYIAADVEQVLGFAPLAQLPDFSEVSEGVAEEYVLRLASAVEHGRKQGSLKNCIFTGTSSGAGVTTLLHRVQEMLQAMGRPTVLVNATGAPSPTTRAASSPKSSPGSATGLAAAPATGLVPAGRLSQSPALLQQMLGAKGASEESLVLTDTAPVTVSAETEYLARFVDCAIVVIESGVTTRAQLRETAATLQRLDVGAVGFVLNRVQLASADRGFRQSVEAVEEHVRTINKNMARRPEKVSSSAAATPASVPAAVQAAPKPASQRSNFEPEVAAAAAAVARFSPSLVSRSAAAASVPVAAAPMAEPVTRFAAPFIAPGHEDAEAGAPPAVESVAAPVEAAPLPVAAPVAVDEAIHTAEPTPVDAAESLESDPEIAAPVAAEAAAVSPTAPFVEAAEHFASWTAPAAGASLASHPVSVAEASQAVEDKGHRSLLAADLASPAAEPEPASHQEFLKEFQLGDSHAPQPVATQPKATYAAQVQETPAAIPEASGTTTPAPVAEADPAMPWWLSDVVRTPEPTRPPVLWQPARIWTARGEHPEVEPATPAAPLEQPVSESAPAGHATEPIAADDPASLSSRLSGLRNLLFELGVKHDDSHQADHRDERLPESSRTAPVYEPRVERHVAAAWSGAEEREVASVRPAMYGASPRLVTAQPEFLPPKPVVIEINRTDTNVGESSTRQDRRATFDDVDVLPSKRGQYKKV